MHAIFPPSELTRLPPNPSCAIPVVIYEKMAAMIIKANPPSM